MFSRKVAITAINADGTAKPCPIAWIDNFAMRNFTNDAVFDDTLPIADGLLEIGKRVPLDWLESAMQDWFQRKGYVTPTETVRVVELPRSAAASP